MLEHLHIQNYAIISQMDIDFSSGFSVITGETGAGKSIIMGALSLLMGERADSKAITEGEQKCVIEAQFSLSPSSCDFFRKLFHELELDFETEIILRRELTGNGKSRAFVNDTPVQLAALRQISTKLVDIHSQHQNLLLREDDFQLALIDSMAGNNDLLDEYSLLYSEYKNLCAQLIDAKKQFEKATQDADYIAFQLNQLNEARLQTGELEALEQEQQQLTHTEEITQSLNAIGDMLEQGNVLSSINDTIYRLRQTKKYHSGCATLHDRIQSVQVELKDIQNDAARLAEKTEYDPVRLEAVESRIDLLNSLLHKHHRQNIDELITLRESLAQSVADTGNLEDRISDLTRQIENYEKKLSAIAGKLSAARHKIAQPLTEQLTALLTRLGIHNAVVDIQFRQTDTLTEKGTDTAVVLFAANKNQTPRPIAQVASGGEMARLMLSMKSLIADNDVTETVIFDEIDAGVSGEIASNMGRIMLQMAQSRQIIAITHLPQIAAIGQRHYRVFKTDNAQRTETHIALLDSGQRINEVASLLSGENITNEALLNAKALLNTDHEPSLF